ncbi:MAG: 6-bladed beta-propeller [Acidobacteriota bacterium]|nr:6-bladed beta-propeller [Acidobacteriota bacterium]
MFTSILMILFFGGEGWVTDARDLSEIVTGVSHLTVLPSGHVYLLDMRESQIVHLDDKGREVRIFGRTGEGPGEFRYGTRLEHLQGRTLVLLDQGGRRFLYFDLEGNYLKQFLMNDKSLKHGTRFIDENRVLYVDAGDIWKPDQRGAEIRLARLDEERDTLLLKNDFRRHGDYSVYKGKNGEARGALIFDWTPASLIAIGQNRAYLGSTNDVDFLVLDLKTEKPVGRIKDDSVRPRPLMEEEVEAQKGAVIINGKKITARDFDSPDYKAPLARGMVDQIDRLWLLENREFESKARRWRVYTASGKLEGVITLTVKQKLYQADAGFIWIKETIEEEEEDVILIKKQTYKLEPVN